MREIWHSALLGVLQGVTEFLPISSSGHLVLLQHRLGIDEPQILFDVMLHLGTLIAVVLVYSRSIGRITKNSFIAISEKNFNNSSDLKLIWFLFLGCIPTGVIGILFKDQLESIFAKPKLVSLMLITTGLILHLPKLRKSQTETTFRFWHAIVIGTAQALAITPGISRSGTTISIALLIGISATLAAEYSFLLSIPAILGAAILKLKDLPIETISLTPLIIGVLTSAIVGWFALRFLIQILNRGKFSIFSYYCFLIGGVSYFFG